MRNGKFVKKIFKYLVDSWFRYEIRLVEIQEDFNRLFVSCGRDFFRVVKLKRLKFFCAYAKVIFFKSMGFL